MTKEEIRNAVMKAAKEYGYDLIMAKFEHPEDKEEFLKRMEDDFNHLYDGEDFYDLFDRIQVDDDTDLMDVMEEGEVFSYDNVSDWYSIGKNEAWKELLRRNPIKVDNIYVVGVDYTRPMSGFKTIVTDSFEEVEHFVSQCVWTYTDATLEVFKNDKLIKHLNIKRG